MTDKKANARISRVPFVTRDYWAAALRGEGVFSRNTILSKSHSGFVLTRQRKLERRRLNRPAPIKGERYAIPDKLFNDALNPTPQWKIGPAQVAGQQPQVQAPAAKLHRPSNMTAATA